MSGVVDDRLARATCNAIGADRLLALVFSSSTVHTARCGLSMTVVGPAIRRLRFSIEGLPGRVRRSYGPGCARDSMSRTHENIFHKMPSSPRTEVFDGVLVQDATPQLTTKGPSSCSTSSPAHGSVAFRMRIDMTALAWSLLLRVDQRAVAFAQTSYRQDTAGSCVRQCRGVG